MHLYIHVPFCRYRCDYCDFFTRTSVPARRQAEIMRAIEAQTGELLRRYEVDNLDTLYVGGGTPSALTGEARKTLLRLLHTLAERYGPAAECTVELNPEDLSRTLLEALENSGVNRFSLGVQSLRDRSLARIGRNPTAAAARRGLELLAGYRRWSADLMAGIPGSSVPETLQSAREVLDFSPDHISVYELGIEERTALGLALRRGRLNAPSADRVAEELDQVEELLTGAGFIHYEVSNYARPGARGLHNLGYWRMEPHLGVGPGAVGTLPEPARIRLTNTRDFSRYCTVPDRGLQKEVIAPADFAGELLMMGLRTDEGVSLSRVANLVGVEPSDLIPETLAAWGLEPDLMDDHRIVLPPETRNLLNRFLLEAFREIDRTVAQS